MRISEHFQCANLKQVVAKFRLHGHQVSMSKHREQTLCTLAARLSASARRAGRPDPMNSVEEVTPTLLSRLGVSEAMMQTALAARCSTWVRHMRLAGEYSVALQEAIELLRSSDLGRADRWPVADLWLAAAWLLWRQRRILDSLVALARAIIARPAVMGRPVKQLLERLALL